MVVSFLCLMSCKKKPIENKPLKVGVWTLDTIHMRGNNQMQFAFGVPDTIYEDQIIDGKIVYKGILDTVNTKLATNDERSRYILYYYTKTRSINYDDKYLMNNIKLDTVGAFTNDTINLFDLKFREPGIHYLDGIIEDEVYIKNADSSGKTRVITKKIRATHKVFVRPRPLKANKA